jgi:peptidoglycan/xylan/chitin deacetylase (PgdA/CDA1 family)
VRSYGAIIRGDSTKKKLSLVFTGDEFADGGNFVVQTLRQQRVKASFFFTGRFYRNPSFQNIIQQLKKDGHYLGPHSDEHLLYCDWNKRDSLLVSKEQFVNDLFKNYEAMRKAGITKEKARFFIPPYEWYNDSIAAWAKELGLQLINLTPGTKSTADYTYPELKNYRGSEEIYNSIIDYEKKSPSGLNGFILLVHIGTDARRTDKFYKRLPQLIKYLKTKGYQFQPVNQLLKTD